MRAKIAGSALTEMMVSLLIVAAIAAQIIQSGSANAIARTQPVARLHAMRLALEFSEWAHRRGLQALGMPVNDALTAAPPAFSCYDGECDAAQGAQHYLAQWRARLLRMIPLARAEICVDQAPVGPEFAWACDPAGSSIVLKLGWPPSAGALSFPPTLVVALGTVT